MRSDERKLLTLAYPGLNGHWSPPINMKAMGSVHVRMRPAGSTAQTDVHLIVADALRTALGGTNPPPMRACAFFGGAWECGLAAGSRCREEMEELRRR